MLAHSVDRASIISECEIPVVTKGCLGFLAFHFILTKVEA